MRQLEFRSRLKVSTVCCCQIAGLATITATKREKLLRTTSLNINLNYFFTLFLLYLETAESVEYDTPAAVLTNVTPKLNVAAENTYELPPNLRLFSIALSIFAKNV